jgi:GNAT superfamily N-acetyltransferase
MLPKPFLDYVWARRTAHECRRDNHQMDEITIRTQLDGGAKETVVAFLNQHNQGVGLSYCPEPVHFFLVDENNNVRGGLLGSTNWDWLRIDILAIDPALRGQQFGRQLMQLAEVQARERGCKMAYVDTFSFQALPFYQKLGYEIFGQLDGFPGEHSRLFLKKSLVS